MKFGLYLVDHLTPEWNSQYIQYEYMKELLDKEVAAASILTSDDNNSARQAYFLYVDASFFQYCEKQATKINTFFAEKLAEALRRFTTLKDEIQYRQLIHEQVNPQRQSSDGVGHCNSDTTFTATRLKRFSSIGPLARILPDRLLNNAGEQRKLPKNFKNPNNLKVAFSEFYLMLVLLQKYQLLNYTGFRKILKKHDKLFQTTRGDEWRKLHIDTATFYTSTAVTELIRDVETIYTDAFESGNRARAMERLRVPPLEERQSPVVTFRLGIFIGMICILLPILFISMAVLNKSRSGNPLAWREALNLYRGTFLIILHTIFCGINVYGWTSSGVNHILIFEIDPRHHLTYQQLLEIGAGLCVLWLLSFIAFVFTSYLDFYPFLQPLIFVILIILFVINPLPIFHRPARYWLLKTLGRIFSAAFHSICFAEFWFTDQLASLELTLFDVEYFMCFYISNHQWWSTNLTSPSSANGVFCTGWTKFLLQASLLAIPSLLRFTQCVRRYYDSKRKFPHLVNAGKYASSFCVVITNSLRRASLQDYGNNPTSNPFIYIWIITAFISATYKLTWDLKMDWGLFDKNAGENKFLRNQLVYSSKIYYYYAIIQDIILRYIWMINIFIYFRTDTAEYSDVIGFSFALAELIRRFVWNFFRLENEHLNNCGEFRAVRDISIAPITSGINFALIDSRLSNEPGIRNRDRRVEGRTSIDEENNIGTTDNVTMEDLENNLTDFVDYQMSRCGTIAILEVNEINATLRDIASRRAHTFSHFDDDLNPSYPILEVGHRNRLLKRSKSV